MASSPALSLSQHDSFELIEEELNDALDQSLHPRGPDMLYDLVGELGLGAGATALDVGCSEGRHTFELARRFGLRVLGVDPVERHIDTALRELGEQASSTVGLGNVVRFALGSAEALPAKDASTDLVWCRDVLCMVEDLEGAYGEFRRVLKPGGRALVYQMFATDSLEPREAAFLLPTMGCVPASMTPETTERAIRAAGLGIEQHIVLGPEWGEFGQEQTGKPARKLLHAGRLLRDRDRFVRHYGQENYDIALGDCLWHVYRLIGKLSDRVYVLSAPE
jgi:ubiquinone/menaquinone biosynthesis C-methylase UbiE